MCLQEELWTLRHEGLMVSEVLRELRNECHTWLLSCEDVRRGKVS